MENNKNKYLIGMFVAMIFWGIAWTAGKIAALHSNPEVAAFWRYAISFVTVIPLIFYFKTSLKTDRVGVLYMLIAGGLTAVFNYLFFAGVTHGDAGFGGTIVTAISPIVTYALSLVIFRQHVSTKEIIALSIGILGALILMRVFSEGLGFINVHSIYFIIGAVVWAVVTIVSQKASKRADPMLYTLVVFGITAFINMLFALPHEPFAFDKYDATFWWTITFIGIVPGTFSTALFFVSAGKLGASKTGVYMFIVPIGAILSSWWVYDEHIELSTIIGAVLAFSAVALFNSKR